MKLIFPYLTLFSFCLLPNHAFGDEGKCVDGDCENGFGTMVHSHKTYVGQFKNGLEEGHGKYTTLDLLPAFMPRLESSFLT